METRSLQPDLRQGGSVLLMYWGDVGEVMEERPNLDSEPSETIDRAPGDIAGRSCKLAAHYAFAPQQSWHTVEGVHLQRGDCHAITRQ